MSSLDPADVPPGWEVWNQESDGRLVLAFRPDVFNAETFPAACLPTLVVAPGRSPDDPPERRARSEMWHVAAYLEPAVRLRELEGSFDTRAAAVTGALTAAERFAAGDVDIESAYQVPRAAYLDRLMAILEKE